MQIRRFEPRLESLRGIAALIVAAHHGMAAFYALPDVSVPLAGSVVGFFLGITNPGAAVMFFFVLSGYVLGQSLERSGAFFPYVVRRALRILPAFLVSVFVAYACLSLVRVDVPPGETTKFFQQAFWPTPTPADLWDNLLLWGARINGPSWSIYPEILGSLALPLLVFAHKTIAPKWQWPLFFVIFIALAFSSYRLLIWF